MTSLEFHVATLALIAAMSLLAWLNWKWKKHLQNTVDQKLKEWEKSFNYHMDSHANSVKRFTEDRLYEFKDELKPASRSRKASQNRKAPSLLKIKKIR